MKKLVSFVRKNARVFATVAILAVAVSARAVGSVDADIQGAVDDGEATFAVVKTVGLSILVFTLGMRFVRKWVK